MKKRMFTMIFAIIMVIAVSIPCVSAATSELVTTKKVSFTAECSKPGYHIQVHKLDEKGKALKDAEFALYKTEADAKAEKNAIATGTSDKNGLVVFNNKNGEEMLLQSGKYFVKETKAPTGYNRYTDVIPAEISVTYGDAQTNGTYIVKGPDLGLVSFDVKNSKTVLPQTGGQGNVIIYSVAVSLAVADGVILLVLRRKKKSADKSA